MVTIYANSLRFRRMGLTQAIRCNRRLAVQQYRFLRRAGLTPNQARDRLFQIMFIGIAGAALIPDAWLAARAERDTGRVESPSSKAGPVPPAGPADEDDSLFARAFRAEMARS